MKSNSQYKLQPLKPTHRLKILNKKLETRCNDAGAGWLNEDGSISIVINPGICLKEDEHLVYTLFPQEKQTK